MKASLRVNRLTGLSTVRRMIPCRKVGAASERICLSVGGFVSLIHGFYVPLVYSQDADAAKEKTHKRRGLRPSP